MLGPAGIELVGTQGRREDARAALLELVATPSMSGEESACAAIFARQARKLGFVVESDAVGNVIAHRTGGSVQRSIDIVLLGHIDTVPGNIVARVEGDVLHGRGSVDAKGPLLTMLLAAARADIPAGIRLVVIAAVGEEAPESIGALTVMHRFQPAACIIGEPSGFDGITLGYKGRLLARLRASVECCHSASENASAADQCFRWWGDILQRTASLNLDRTSNFDLIQAGIISAESRSDGSTDSCSMQVSFRLPPWAEPQSIGKLIRECAPPHSSIEVWGSERAFLTDRNDPVVRAITAAIRERGIAPKPKRKSGTSDMNVVGPVWRCPIAAYGPGDSSLDHTPHEQIDLREFEAAVGILTTALARLAAEIVETARER